MPRLARLYVSTLAIGCLIAATSATQAATTTYSSATSISTITAGDTAVLVNGGSLTNGF